MLGEKHWYYPTNENMLLLQYWHVTGEVNITLSGTRNAVPSSILSSAERTFIWDHSRLKSALGIRNKKYLHTAATQHLQKYKQKSSFLWPSHIVTCKIWWDFNGILMLNPYILNYYVLCNYVYHVWRLKQCIIIHTEYFLNTLQLRFVPDRWHERKHSLISFL